LLDTSTRLLELAILFGLAEDIVYLGTELLGG
jgi:hypothetical protein